MKKYKKIDYLFNLVLVTIIIGYVLILTHGTYIYGSELDWESQHYYIPDYFRKIFYETGQILPQFAANIGGGQNIFNYSYYGLCSPIILISYFLPFVSMRTYICVSSVVLVIISVLLFYRWIYCKYGTKVAMISTLLFETATPLIFHSHRHIMFVNYMPFMILALMGVDLYFKKKRRGLLVVSCVGMILTSYFFSVSGLVALTIYAVGVYLKEVEKFRWIDFLKEAVAYAGNLICSVMISCFFLLPTLYTLLFGRAESNVENSFLKLVLPKFYNSDILYGTYAMGVTAIFMIAVIYFMFKDSIKQKFISICFFAIAYFGIFLYVLNGTMYIDGKVLIAFLPVACYITASFINSLYLEEVDFKKLIKIVVICNVPLLITHSLRDLLYIADIIFTMAVIYMLIKKKMNKVFCAYVVAFSLGVSLFYNLRDDLVVADSEYFHDEGNIEKVIGDVFERDEDHFRLTQDGSKITLNLISNAKQMSTTMYSSICNSYYNNFFFNEICNENPFRNSAILSSPKNLLFNMYIGNKYIVGKDLDIKGYEKTDISSENIFVYKNQDVKKIGWSSNKVIKLKDYEELKYPYNVMALYKYAVVENTGVFADEAIENIDIVDSDEIKFDEIEKIETGSLSIYDKEGILTEKGKDKYWVSVPIMSGNKERNFKTISVPIDEKYKDKIIFVSLDVDNSEYSNEDASNSMKKYPNKDVIITINGVKNKLTNPDWKYYNNNTSFEYTIASNESVDSLEIMLYDGEYEISDFRLYALDYSDLLGIIEEDDNIEISQMNTKDFVLKGNIYCKEDGFFNLTFPYDEGFKVYVDGEEVKYYLSDTAFIGFPIKKGIHEIKVRYECPVLKEGIAISITGLAIFVIMVIWRKYLCYINKKKKLLVNE